MAHLPIRNNSLRWPVAPAYRRRPSGASTPTPPGRTGPPAAPSGCAIRRDPSRHQPQAPAGCRPAATRPAGPSSHQQKREGVQGGAAARTYWAPHHITRPKKCPPCRTGSSQGQYGGGVGFGSGRCWECAHPGGGRRGWSGVRRAKLDCGADGLAWRGRRLEAGWEGYAGCFWRSLPTYQ